MAYQTDRGVLGRPARTRAALDAVFGGAKTGQLFGARLVAMTASFAANLYTIHVLAQRGGSVGYALFALIVSLLTAAPFADLGTAASVVNATADVASGQLSRTDFTRHLRRVFALDTTIAAAGVTAAVVCYLTDSWGLLLGRLGGAQSASLATSLVVVCIAVMVPLGVGARVLQGLGQALVTVRWQIPAGPIQVVIVLALQGAGAPAAYYALSIALATLISAGGTAASALRRLRPVLREAIEDPSSRAQDGLLTTAAPYFIALLASTAAYQVDRIVLSHVSDATSVAAYSLVGQFVLPGLSLVVMASQNLWPIFRSITMRGESARRLVLQQTAVFAALGGVVAAVAGLASGLLGPSIAANKFAASAGTIFAACAYLLLAAAQRPLAMLLNDRPGLWMQALWGTVAASISVTLTVVWGRSHGAAGAWAASLVACAAAQLLPLWVYAAHRDRAATRIARSRDT